MAFIIILYRLPTLCTIQLIAINCTGEHCCSRVRSTLQVEILPISFSALGIVVRGMRKPGNNGNGT